VSGEGAMIETEAVTVARGLEALAIAAVRYGPAERVTWRVSGRLLELSPVTAEAGPVVVADEVRDLGSLVARLVIEQLGGSLELRSDATLRVTL